MKKIFPQTFIILLALIIYSCAAPIELTSTWKNKDAQAKASPRIMVFVRAKTLANRKNVEDFFVAKLTKMGYKAIPSLDIIKAETAIPDSVTLVNILRENKIDLLLANKLVDVKKKEKYIDAVQSTVPNSVYATPYGPYGVGFGYNSYYSTFYSGYRMEYDTKETPGYSVVTDLEVIIESRMYDVTKPELVWFGQSKSYTEDPSEKLFKEFAKIVVDDIVKKNLIIK